MSFAFHAPEIMELTFSFFRAKKTMPEETQKLTTSEFISWISPALEQSGFTSTVRIEGDNVSISVVKNGVKKSASFKNI